VDLVWEAGDLGTAGDFRILLELLDSAGELETACEACRLTVKEKVLRPDPIITSVTPDPATVAVALAVVGDHFLDLVETKLVEVDTSTETVLAIDETTNPLTRTSFDTDPLPVLPGGNYQLIAVGVDGDSEPYAFVILPIITTFSPTALAVLATLTVTGVGFTGATGVDLIRISDGTVIAMTNYTFVSDTEVSADVPAGTAADDYIVRVTGALNPSNQLGTLTVQ
jgi:hypothetical protein